MKLGNAVGLGIVYITIGLTLRWDWGCSSFLLIICGTQELLQVLVLLRFMVSRF
jgi:hypothetical protein